MRKKINGFCKNCSLEIEKYSSTHIYCVTCALKIKRTRDIRNATIGNKVARKRAKEKGLVINEASEHVSMAYSSKQDEALNPSFGHMFRFWIPYDINLSKNKLLRVTRTGHVFTPTQSSTLVNSITLITKMAKIKWNINKVYLEIIVQKPTMRGDAINFLDGIADGVKKGIGIDDNWFSVEKIDWEIVKKDPKIYISVMQESIDKFPCSSCGIFQLFDQYGKRAHSRYGITDKCKTCLGKKAKVLIDKGDLV